MPGKFGTRKRGPYGGEGKPGVLGTAAKAAKQKAEEEATAAVTSTEAATDVTAAASPETSTTEQEATAAPLIGPLVGPPKPPKKLKKTKLVAAGTFSLPGAGRAAALRSPGLIRGRIGPPSRSFTGKKRRRAVEVKPPEDIGSLGNVAAASPSGGLTEDEKAKLLAGKVLAGGL